MYVLDHRLLDPDPSVDDQDLHVPAVLLRDLGGQALRLVRPREVGAVDRDLEAGMPLPQRFLQRGRLVPRRGVVQREVRAQGRDGVGARAADAGGVVSVETRRERGREREKGRGTPCDGSWRGRSVAGETRTRRTRR